MKNAARNLILHLCGNARQCIIRGIRGDVDVRVRPLEFLATGGVSRQALQDLFTETMSVATVVIASVPYERLTEIIHPQDTDASVLETIYQVVGHVQQHMGQIILLTKQMTGEDLDLVMLRPR